VALWSLLVICSVSVDHRERVEINIVRGQNVFEGYIFILKLVF
jgi:hypothetical protein